MPGLLTRITSFIPSRVKRVAEAYRTSSTRVFQSGPTDDSSGMTPWGFFISYYGLVLLAVALITNRIWAVVRPAGPMDRRQAEQDDPSIEQPRWKIILRRTLTSTQTHRLLRIPSLLYVLYSVYLLTLCLLPHPTSPTASPWMASLPLANQTLTMPTEKLFKRVFTSIAVGLITGTFARSLEGFAHVGSQANLFSFGFLLHLYSNPFMHRKQPEPSRPDWNILFVIWLTTVQFAWLHGAECSQRWARNRLLPTAVCGSIQVTHFTYLLLTSPSALPAFTLASNMFTLFHFTILALTLILSFFTQLLTQGTINLDTLLPISDWPSTSEDFPTVLLKLSACCLTHTKMGGLGNEVGLIELPAESYVDLSNSAFARDPTGPHTDLYVASSPLDRHVSTGFGREITQVKASFRPGILGSWEGGDDSPYWTEFSRFYTALKEWLGALGWWTLGWVPGGRGAWDLGARALRFGGTRRLSRGGRWGLRLVPILAEGDALIGPDFEQEEEDRREEHPQDDVGEGEEDENVYKKFLAGGYTQVNDPSEEDDPTYHPSRSSHQIRPQLRARSYSSSSSSSSSTSSSHSSSSSPAAYSDEPLSTLSMLPPSPTLPTVLLAHMTSSSSSPLTRRRFNALLPSLSVLDPASSSSTTSSSFFSSTLSPPPFSSSSPYAGQEALSLKEFVRQRREPSVTPSPSNSFSRPDAGDEPEGRVCVICRADERTVILWPCRCLALCNDCRETLATRGQNGALSGCPCCRSKVEGYSRIYIP